MTVSRTSKKHPRKYFPPSKGGLLAKKESKWQVHQNTQITESRSSLGGPRGSKQEGDGVASVRFSCLQRLSRTLFFIIYGYTLILIWHTIRSVLRAVQLWHPECMLAPYLNIIFRMDMNIVCLYEPPWNLRTTAFTCTFFKAVWLHVSHCSILSLWHSEWDTDMYSHVELGCIEGNGLVSFL